jgi:hypothetical protein
MMAIWKWSPLQQYSFLPSYLQHGYESSKKLTLQSSFALRAYVVYKNFHVKAQRPSAILLTKACRHHHLQDVKESESIKSKLKYCKYLL